MTSCFVHRFPRVGAALDDAGAPLAAVTGSWFLTLYVNHLPWEVALRVWDVLLFERTRRVLFQTALALIDVNAKRVVDAGRSDRLMECAVSIAPSQFDGSELLVVATCGAHADVSWSEIMSLYAAKHAELTTAGVDGTANGARIFSFRLVLSLATDIHGRSIRQGGTTSARA